MPFWSRLFGRKTLEQLPPFARWPESKAGVDINTTTALSAATIMACTRAIAEGVAQTEIKFHRQSGGKERILDHPLLPILTRRPNPWQTSFEFRETLLFHLVLCGNAFVFVNRVRGQVVELIPIEPGKVWVQRNPDMTMTYTVTFEDGRAATLTAADIWHLRGPSWNSWMGLEAIKVARDAIGLSIALETSHARLHKNGLQPSGVYTMEGTMVEEQYKRLRAYLERHFAGADNAGTPLILDRNAKWIPQTMTGVDSQHLETRKHQIEEICRHMRVIPLMVQHSDKTATYASAEQMFIAHVVHTIAPWATRFEQSAEANLLAPGEDVDIRFNLKSLMRGAAKDRAEYYAKALGSGGSPAWMTQNEVREDDGLDAIEGGDALPQPANMTTPASVENSNAAT
jgi:HK97 family phage portal protein